jgi:PAS domain S-box-containing protein
VYYFSVSGAPRFDPTGKFSGYWGVSRDVTLEITAQQAAAASESRYRELFARSPSPLMLHRHGKVIDANEAAAQLIGVQEPAALRGFDLLTLFGDGEARERSRIRTQQLERLPIGQGLPVVEAQIEALDGRRRVVQATGVRVDTPTGPASLSIFFDITARVAAESALRRSETMLSMLFATSPDCITLTDVATGRYLLVNDAFVRVTGHDRTDVIGRTAHEIGVWYDPADRDRLLAAIQADRGAIELPITFRHKSGAPVSMLVSAAQFELDGRAHLVINARDVTQTDRVRMESDAMLRNASIGIAFTRDKVFVRANPAFERMVGWAEGTLAGQSGEVVWPDAQAYADVGRTIGPLLATGQPVELERPVRRRDGSTLLARILAQAVDPRDPARSGTIWISEDVTERRQIEQALAAARDAAEAASRAKSAFLANTSHEIRTPLNALLGLTRMARAADLAPERRSQYLDQIHASAKQLAGIISDILDLSKIEAGKIVIESRPFDLRVMLESVHRSSMPMAEARGLTLSLDVDPALPLHVIGDELRLQQIVANYVSNAIKFTDRGRVRVEAVRTRGGTVRIAVHDSGPGIAVETQARLFRPFTQADESTTRRYGGTGLGLSICRELAVLMGGEVGLSSQPGQGSTFWVDLPLTETDVAPEWAHTSDVDPELLRGARVMLVEDNPVNMLIAVAMLEQWGIDVEQASDGAAALAGVERAASRGRPVELVLMDVQMPGMSGHETARALRARWDARELPIIALTAAALVSERDEALAAGMDDFLTKPIDPVKLREALTRHLLAMAP